MILTIFFALITGFTEFYGKAKLGFGGVNALPFFLIILGQRGENVLVSSTILCFAMVIADPGKLMYLWSWFPTTVLIGLLAKIIPSILILVILYYAIDFFVSRVINTPLDKYIPFLIINFGLNIVAWRMFTLLF